MLTAAYRNLREQHDDEWGGFGGAPKFPQTMSLELLLRAHVRNHAPAAIETVRTSLDAMASGGMYDHLGGGFARYSVDDIWLVLTSRRCSTTRRCSPARTCTRGS